MPNPVRWADTVRLLRRLGVEKFVEVGAGGVLCGLLKNIDPAAKSARFGEAADWEKVNELIA